MPSAIECTLRAEVAATKLWHSLSSQEQRAYMMATADAGGWWNTLTHNKQIEYVKNHPASKFAHHLTELPGNIQYKFSKLSENSKKAVADWHEKTPTEKMVSVGKGLFHAGKHVRHQVVHHAKHEVETYKGAAAALTHLAAGKKWKDLDPHHKKGLKTALVHAGLTAGSMAMGDVSGHGGITVSQLLSHFAAEHAHHSMVLGAGEVALKSGNTALKKATAADDSKAKIAAAQKVAALLLKAEIPTSEWIKIMRAIERKKQASKETSALSDKEQKELDSAVGNRNHFRDLVKKAKGTKNEKYWQDIHDEHDENVKRLSAKRDGKMYL